MTGIRAIALMSLAFAIGAAMAASASADEGGISNSLGAALVKKNVTGLGGEAKLEALGGLLIRCKESRVSGLIPATEYLEETVNYKGCKKSSAGCKGGVGAKTEELVMLVGVLTRRVSQPEGEVLLLTFIREGHFQGGVLLFECGTEKDELRGGYLTPAGPSKKLAKTFTFSAAQEGGKQKQSEYESEGKSKLRDIIELSLGGGKFEQAGVGDKREVTFEEEAEFNRAADFRVTNSSPETRVKAGATQSFKIQNISGVNNQVLAELNGAPVGFEVNEEEATVCKEKVYGIGATCTFNVKYPMAVRGFIFTFAEDGGGRIATSVMVGE